MKERMYLNGDGSDSGFNWGGLLGGVGSSLVGGIIANENAKIQSDTAKAIADENAKVQERLGVLQIQTLADIAKQKNMTDAQLQALNLAQQGKGGTKSNTTLYIVLGSIGAIGLLVTVFVIAKRRKK